MVPWVARFAFSKFLFTIQIDLVLTYFVPRSFAEWLHERGGQSAQLLQRAASMPNDEGGRANAGHARCMLLGLFPKYMQTVCDAEQRDVCHNVKERRDADCHVLARRTWQRARPQEQTSFRGSEGKDPTLDKRKFGLECSERDEAAHRTQVRLADAAQAEGRHLLASPGSSRMWRASRTGFGADIY